MTLLPFVAISVGCLVSGFFVAMAGQKPMSLALCITGAAAITLGVMIDINVAGQ